MRFAIRFACEAPATARRRSSGEEVYLVDRFPPFRSWRYPRRALFTGNSRVQGRRRLTRDPKRRQPAEAAARLKVKGGFGLKTPGIVVNQQRSSSASDSFDAPRSSRFA